LNLSPEVDWPYNENMDIENELKNIFAASLHPIILDFYYTDEEFKDFTCIFSNDPKCQQQKPISIYETPSILRTLALKSEIFSLSLREKMYANSDPELCYILEWNDQIRKIILFNFAYLTAFDEDSFVSCLAEKRSKLHKVFQHMYQQKVAM